MTTYAVIQTGGKQYRVQPGDVIDVERLDAEVGSVVELADVRMVNGEGGLLVGTPQVAGARVLAAVQEQVKGPKIYVAKFKAKTHYRKRTGHRQRYTRLHIDQIVTEGAVAPQAQ